MTNGKILPFLLSSTTNAKEFCFYRFPPGLKPREPTTELLLLALVGRQQAGQQVFRP